MQGHPIQAQESFVSNHWCKLLSELAACKAELCKGLSCFLSSWCVCQSCWSLAVVMLSVWYLGWVPLLPATWGWLSGNKSRWLLGCFHSLSSTIASGISVPHWPLGLQCPSATGIYGSDIDIDMWYLGYPGFTLLDKLLFSSLDCPRAVLPSVRDCFSSLFPSVLSWLLATSISQCWRLREAAKVQIVARLSY